MRSLWLALLLCYATHLSAAGLYDQAVSADTLDLAQCKTVVAGKNTDVTAADLAGVLTSKAGAAWTAGSVRDGQDVTFQFVLAFTQPVSAGSFQLSTSHWDGFLTRKVYALKSTATGVNPDNEGDWELLPARNANFFTLPPAASIKAFRVVEVRRGGTAAISQWRFYKSRLLNLTPDATGIGERGPFCSHASAVINGWGWNNAGLDPDPTNKATRILRAPVSDVAPSWFILNWDQPQEITGFFLRSNALQFKVYAYTGSPSLNPALGSNDDWLRVTHAVAREEKLDHDRSFARWITCEPVKTRALKILILETAPKGNCVFNIESFAAFSDLGAAPVPALKYGDTPPFEFTYKLTQPGETALVIKTPDGKPLRTLFCQIEKLAGDQPGNWDLKDDLGRTVPAGSYTWEALNAPPLELHYQMTVTPNLEARSSERTPWFQEISGPHGWMADHAMSTTCTTLGDHVYFGAPGVEGGTAFIDCDLNGVKQWGKVNFGAWTGVSHLTADSSSVYIHAGDQVYKMDPATHEIKSLWWIHAPTRKGYMQSMVARDGKLYLARSGTPPFIDNAASDYQVDLDNSLPKYPTKIVGNFRTYPNPRADFLRVLRLSGSPPGQATAPDDRPQQHWPVYLESTQGKKRRQFVLLSFKEPVSIGSLVLPIPAGAPYKISFSTLRANATYPPMVTKESDWVPFENNGKPGWNCIAAPANTVTRGLRITFEKPGDDVDDVMDGPGENPATKPGTESAGDDLLGSGDKNKDATAGGWTGRLEGLKILRRRLESLAPKMKIQVNSGVVTPDGVWDAKRDTPITANHPGIYVMEFDAVQSVCGLAIKEIDGANTEVDVWTGPEAGPVTLDGTENWKKVTTYKQSRRSWYHPDFAMNAHARYMDGYVNFKEEIKTRAIRLRVVEPFLDSDAKPQGLRSDLGGLTLDPRRCRIWGVAPLANLGGEAPIDSSIYLGLDVVDTQSGKLIETVKCDPGYSLSINAAGELCTLRDYGILKLDPKSGQTTPIVKGLTSPERLTTGLDGSYYVFCGHEGQSVIKAFDKDGKPKKDLGHPGSIQPGPWDPERLSNVNDLCADKNGNVWVMDTNDQPRRIIEFKGDGSFVQELLGNTHYGGGGTLNRYDLNRAYLGRVEFDLDWEKRISRVKGILAEHIYGEDLIPIKIKDRTYLTTTPLSYSATQSFAAVYVYDDKTGTARLAAAFGDAHQFPPMFQPDVLETMKGNTPKQYYFNWSDQNGNGKVEASEVQLTLKTKDGQTRLGRFERDLSALSGNQLYSVKDFLADGTPIYEIKTLNASGLYRLTNGNIVAMDAHSPVYKSGENAVYTPGGERVWGYPTDHPSVSGLWLPPWHPGYVTNQFAIIGHETAASGDLGEYFVIHANNGQWNIWTADGLLAGHVLYHVLDKRSHNLNAPTSARGTRVDPLTAGQEHFHGFFTQSEKDGKAYIITGHNFVSISEVKGMEEFKRTRGEIKVTPDDLAKAHAWESEHTRREILTSLPIVESRRAPKIPNIDGVRGEGEWPEPQVSLEDVAFTMTYDANNLYVSYFGEIGLLKNSGTEFQRYFKTGACLDLLIGTDPKADLARQNPAAGDLRVLMTFANDKPKVVLYQAINPNAKPGESWDTYTDAGGKSHFDRVCILENAMLAMSTTENKTFVEASIPLKDLGLKIAPDLRLKMDWGVLTTNDGNQVKTRSYWTNKTANGTADEALESRLEPHLWGYVVFPGTAKNAGNAPGPDYKEDKGGDILDILER